MCYPYVQSFFFILRRRCIHLAICFFLCAIPVYKDFFFYIKMKMYSVIVAHGKASGSKVSVRRRIYERKNTLSVIRYVTLTNWVSVHSLKCTQKILICWLHPSLFFLIIQLILLVCLSRLILLRTLPTVPMKIMDKIHFIRIFL